MTKSCATWISAAVRRLGGAAGIVLALTAVSAPAAAVCTGTVCATSSESRRADGQILVTVRISAHPNARLTHFNVRHGGRQFEMGGAGGSFTALARPGEKVSYSAQTCQRGGVLQGSSCQGWASFHHNVSSAPASVTAACTVYQHRDHQGAAFNLGPGDRLQMAGERCGHTVSHGRAPTIHYHPSWNDQISSFKVRSGCTIRLHEHAHGCGGSGATFVSDKSYTYVGSGWNDKASHVECWCRR